MKNKTGWQLFKSIIDARNNKEISRQRFIEEWGHAQQAQGVQVRRILKVVNQ